MALTLPRWVAALVIGCLIASVVLQIPFLPTDKRPDHEEQALYARARHAGTLVARAARRLRGIQFADSVRAALMQLPRSDSSRTIIGRGLEPSLEFLRPAVARMNLNRPRHRAAPVDVALTLDRPKRIGDVVVSTSWWATMPVLPVKAGEPCLKIIRLSEGFGAQSVVTVDNRWMRSRVNRILPREAAGPCAFYEAFGAPGPEIDRWLRAGAWRFGMLGPWSRPDRDRARRDSALQSPFAAWQESQFRFEFTSEGYRCITGDRGTCAALVLDPTVDAKRPVGTRVAENGILDLPWTWTPFTYIDGSLGGPQRGMFADMIRLLGQDRFQKFWTSDKAPADAFFAATGQDIGAWTADWARDIYGERGRGPAVSVSTAMTAVLVSLLALGSAIAASNRREVA